MEAAPDINCALGWNGHETGKELVERAIKIGAHKVQFFKPYFNQDMIDKAHANGIMCNVFWSDDAEEAKKYIAMGIDTILTNDYNLISQVIK